MNFVDAQNEGQGKITYPNGDIYHGDTVNNLAKGYGRYLHKDGSVYEGFWENNKQHGFGKEIWADGTIFTLLFLFCIFLETVIFTYYFLRNLSYTMLCVKYDHKKLFSTNNFLLKLRKFL